METKRPVVKVYKNPMVKGAYRNHPCICGSGKKMKTCHGKERYLVESEYNEVMRLGKEHNQKALEFQDALLQEAAKLATQKHPEAPGEVLNGG